MKYNPSKGYQLKYEITDIKLRKVVSELVASGLNPTVKLVAKEAGVSLSTAYAHKCQDMILEELMKK